MERLENISVIAMKTRHQTALIWGSCITKIDEGNRNKGLIVFWKVNKEEITNGSMAQVEGPLGFPSFSFNQQESVTKMTHPKPPHQTGGCILFLKTFFSGAESCFSNNHQIKTPRDLRSSWYFLSGKFGEIYQGLSVYSFRWKECQVFIWLLFLSLGKLCLSVHVNLSLYPLVHVHYCITLFLGTRCC